VLLSLLAQYNKATTIIIIMEIITTTIIKEIITTTIIMEIIAIIKETGEEISLNITLLKMMDL